MAVLGGKAVKRGKDAKSMSCETGVKRPDAWSGHWMYLVRGLGQQEAGWKFPVSVQYHLREPEVPERS